MLCNQQALEPVEGFRQLRFQREHPEIEAADKKMRNNRQALGTG
jgi:hypothetical protein